ncbi:unnamed protein product [Phytomonas sp. Hart1]|nr:unnamed protein product [Phytomonas sp. Hart1]|eukprot:CCW72310.1 unnamed protein product [Phytomonas sp. isolate Hart1]
MPFWNKKSSWGASSTNTSMPLFISRNSQKSASESCEPIQHANVSEISDESIQKALKLYERRGKQLIIREEKARQVLVSEEKMVYADFVASEKFDKGSILIFLQFRDAAVNEAETKWRQQKQWMEYRLLGQMRSTLEEETAIRQKIIRLEGRLWQTIAHLHRIESTPLLLVMRLVQLVEAEKMRRSYLMSVEISEALAMNIPNYMPSLICAHVRGPVRKKIDYLSNERCPFVCREECPYYTKKLIASNSARGPSVKANAHLSDDDDANIRFLRYSTLHKGHYKHHYSNTAMKIYK